LTRGALRGNNLGGLDRGGSVRRLGLGGGDRAWRIRRGARGAARAAALRGALRMSLGLYKLHSADNSSGAHEKGATKPYRFVPLLLALWRGVLNLIRFKGRFQYTATRTFHALRGPLMTISAARRAAE